MRKRVVSDGTPDEVKVSCPVCRGGKSGDNLKGLRKGKGNTSQSLQMAERALLSPDELKNLPKGDFIVMKTGTHPMRTVQRALNDLECAGCIERQHRYRENGSCTSNLYIINMEGK